MNTNIFHLSEDLEDYIDLLKQVHGSLTHMDWELDYTYLKVTEGGFIDLIASIESLKYLRLVCKSHLGRTFHLDHSAFPFLTVKHTGLEAIKICAEVKYQFSAKYVDLMSGAPVNQLLKTLDLDVKIMDIWCLKYISEKFKKVKTLSLQANDAVTVGSLKKISTEEIETIIQNFCKYCQEIKGAVKVDLSCEGREERIQILRNQKAQVR